MTSGFIYTQISITFISSNIDAIAVLATSAAVPIDGITPNAATIAIAAAENGASENIIAHGESPANGSNDSSSAATAIVNSIENHDNHSVVQSNESNNGKYVTTATPPLSTEAEQGDGKFSGATAAATTTILNDVEKIDAKSREKNEDSRSNTGGQPSNISADKNKAVNMTVDDAKNETGERRNNIDHAKAIDVTSQKEQSSSSSSSSPTTQAESTNYYHVRDTGSNTDVPLYVCMKNLYKSTIDDNPSILSTLNDQRISLLKVISNMSISISRSIWDLQDNSILTALLNLIDKPQNNYKNAVNRAVEDLLEEVKQISSNVTETIRRSGYSDLEAIQLHILTLESGIKSAMHADTDAEAKDTDLVGNGSKKPLCNNAMLEQTQKQQMYIETMPQAFVDSYRDGCINAFQNYTATALYTAQTAFTDVFSTVEMLVGTLLTRKLPAPEAAKPNELTQVKTLISCYSYKYISIPTYIYVTFGV